MHWHDLIQQNLNILVQHFIPVQFGDGISSCFTNIWRHIADSLFQRKHHNGYNHRDPDTRQNSQCTGPDQLVWILIVE